MEENWDGTKSGSIEDEFEGYNYIKQRHVHEILGVVAKNGESQHSHRFATVSGEAILLKEGSHIHRIIARTDFHGHYHEILSITGPALYVGKGKHLHFTKGKTSVIDGHSHNYQAASLIDDPLL